MEQALGSQFTLTRYPVKLTGDPSRTIVRLFMSGDKERLGRIIDRVNGLSDNEAENILRAVFNEFETRHPDLRDILLDHYNQAYTLSKIDAASSQKKLLIGAYLSMEYSFESAALFNPSMVQAIEQNDVPAGGIRFIMSLRAVGEGHLSSIVFRRGIIGPDGEISVEGIGMHPRQLKVRRDKLLNKNDLRTKLEQLGHFNGNAENIFSQLPETFTDTELVSTIDRVRRQQENIEKIASRLMWIARSNYSIELPKLENVADIVLFPISETESQGMEDMRLVRFENDDGSFAYYGTYTAYDGRKILPQMMSIEPNGNVEVNVLFGKFAQNKGMALFPRKINGEYFMLARVDGENNYLLRSQDIHIWNEGQILQTPRFPWEFVQVGNCGSPIETEAGWLLLTHGVGPLRRYCMGAVLLDINNPSRIIGQLEEPLLVPTAHEWSGYVPNVVYSCGAMVHNGRLYIPYGISDTATGFVSFALNELLDALK